MEDLRQLINEHKDLIVNFRRELHQIPETAFAEKKTSAYVADQVKRLKLNVQTGIAKYGVIGLMDTGRPGPTLMMRADMDALPVMEATDLPFASAHDGVMHACGHDAHMAMLLGAVTILTQIADELNGVIKFLFQPAEEGPGGAKPMIDEGILENPRVDYAIACHLSPDVPEGSIGIRPGPIMAAMDRFDIKIIGQGGHGAMPHLCVDALEVGTQVVSALQRIVSRHIKPIEPTVITVGRFQAGSAFNIIPGEAELSGTTRTFNEEIWHSWEERIVKVVRGVCESMGAEFELKFTPGYPPTINDEAMTEVVSRCAARVVGPDKVVQQELATYADDMAFYLQKVKGCFYFLGVGREGCAPLHNPRFDFNENVLLLGVETHCQVALDLLK